MKETVYKCEVCKKPVNGDGVSVVFDEGGDYLNISIMSSLDDGEEHYCGMEHLIKDVAKQIEVWKRKMVK